MSRASSYGELDRDDLGEALRSYVALGGWQGPTAREYQEALALSSTSVAQYRIRALVRAGWLEPIPGEPGSVNRGYRLTPRGREVAGASPEQRKDG